MVSLLAYIRRLIGGWFRGSSHVRVFVWRSKYSRYSLPSLSVFKTMSPQRSSFCSILTSAKTKVQSCCLAAQYLTELAVNLIQASFFQKESQFRRPWEPLWLLVCSLVHVAWVAFVSLSTRLLFFWNQLSLKIVIAVTGATQMAFNTSQNSAERWRFKIFSSLGPCS